MFEWQLHRQYEKRSNGWDALVVDMEIRLSADSVDPGYLELDHMELHELQLQTFDTSKDTWNSLGWMKRPESYTD